MKTITKVMAIAIVALCASAKVFATDLIVEEFGTPPAYSSISAAVAAAVDGDRIIIKNRAGNIPWIENISIAKSLQFLSYANDTFFVVQGTYTITAAAGRIVTFIGMNNLSGNITYSGSAGIKATTVNVMDSWLQNGYVGFNNSSYVVNLISSSIDQGYVYLNYGSVIGNSIVTTNALSTYSILCSNASAFQNDTVMIIGNKITNQSSNPAVYWSSGSSLVHIKNNFITHQNYGIEITNTATSAYYNFVFNNTILAVNTGSLIIEMYVSNIPSGSILEVMNNVLDATSSGTKYGIYNAGGNNGQTDIYYNHIDASFNLSISAGFTFAGNNNTAASFSLAADGHMNAGAPGIDGGNPGAPYYDLDLTVGDAGCYGGSMTLDNFFPLHSGSARVYMVAYPFNVRQGNTLNVKANAFDR